VPGRLQAPTMQDDFLLQMLQVNVIFQVNSIFHLKASCPGTDSHVEGEYTP